MNQAETENISTLELGISVVVCCYNSAARLPETLKYLARQVLPGSIPWEVVVVVDKNSTDDTTLIAGRVWKELGNPTRMRMMEESRPGKIAALKSGFKAARYEVLVTVDDDNWLDENYLRLAFDVLDQNSQVGIAGGRIAASFEVEPPAWFAELQSAFGVGPQGKSSGDITAYKPHVAGAGMVVRKSAYEQLNHRQFQFLCSGGRRGKLTTGDDIELCYALVLLGYQVWYEERLKLTHFMPQGRLTQPYVFSMLRRNRESMPLLACYEIALRGTDASAFKYYFHRVRLLGFWVFKTAMKFLLGRQSWVSVRIAMADWIQSLVDYGVLHRVLRDDLPRVLLLKAKHPTHE